MHQSIKLAVVLSAVGVFALVFTHLRVVRLEPTSISPEAGAPAQGPESRAREALERLFREIEESRKAIVQLDRMSPRMGETFQRLLAVSDKARDALVAEFVKYEDMSVSPKEWAILSEKIDRLADTVEADRRLWSNIVTDSFGPVDEGWQNVVDSIHLVFRLARQVGFSVDESDVLRHGRWEDLRLCDLAKILARKVPSKTAEEIEREIRRAVREEFPQAPLDLDFDRRIVHAVSPHGTTDIETKTSEAQPGATDNPDDAQRLREDH